MQDVVTKNAASVALPAASLLLLVAASLAAQAPVLERVSEERVEEGGFYPSSWWHAVDEADGEVPRAAHGWEQAAPTLRAPETPGDWTGYALFRLDLDVSEELVNRPLALRLHRHHGASRIYLDGRLLTEIGIWSLDPNEFRPSLRPEPIPLIFETAGRHELLVRYVNPEIERYQRVGYIGGFTAWIGTMEAATAQLAREQRLHSGRRSLFPTVFVSFAVLHLLLWAFRRQSRENLYFSLMSISLALLAFLLSHKAVSLEPRIVFWSESAMNVAGVGFAVFGVLFVHRALSDGVPRWLRWFVPLVAAVLVWGTVSPRAAEGVVFLTMLAGLVEMGRGVTLAVRRRVSGALILALAILAVVVGFGSGILALMNVLPRIPILTFTVPFASILVLIVSMSVYLARRVAQTHGELEEQLERVRTLSEEKLDQERQAARARTQRKLLEAEVQRKQQELEEARELQLSMLPRHIPDHPQFEIAAHMKTATEVGGDYYDFDLGDDGALTVAIGDATGHGLRAGTMVTATKSLFNALGADEDLATTVRRSNAALKGMNLRSLNMALLLARFDEDGMQMSAAGMPFPLIHRHDGELESVEISGMPLGSLRSFPYQAHPVRVAPGDSILLMSDGFPELLNADEEMLGYERAGEIFRAVAAEPADTIVEHLVTAGEEWRGEVEPEDDITFVVLRMR